MTLLIRLTSHDDKFIDKRLDKSIIDFFDSSYSRNDIQKFMKNKIITVNNTYIKNSYKLKFNDQIRINFDEIKTSISPVKGEIEILYEDKHLVIINKSSNSKVHGTNFYDITLVNNLVYLFPEITRVGGDSLRPGIVHRLDKNTTGCLIIAKTNKTYTALINMFKNHEIKKFYLVLVYGIIKKNCFTIETLISRSISNPIRFNASSQIGKLARTNFKLIKNFYMSNMALLKVDLHTGRTHQIRVHTEYIEHPIYNDPIYNNLNVIDYSCKYFGQFLHAETVEFIHPITHQRIVVKAPLPIEFEKKLSELTLKESSC